MSCRDWRGVFLQLCRLARRPSAEAFSGASLMGARACDGVARWPRLQPWAEWIPFVSVGSLGSLIRAAQAKRFVENMAGEMHAGLHDA